MSSSAAPAPAALPFQQAGPPPHPPGLLQWTNVYAPFYLGGGGEAKGGFHTSFSLTVKLENNNRLGRG